MNGWKRTPGIPTVNLPEKFHDFAGIGCRVLDWRGRKVTLICFRDNSQFKDTVHLLVIDADDLPGARPGSQPVFRERDHIATASWSDDQHTYILAGHRGTRYLADHF